MYRRALLLAATAAFVPTLARRMKVSLGNGKPIFPTT